MSVRYEVTSSLDGAQYQSWLRRRIAKLEAIQAQRIESRADVLEKIDQVIERADLELANLKAQQTIGSVK
jgi:hypothetical protein